MKWRVSICRLFAFNWAAEPWVCWPQESRYKAGEGESSSRVEINARHKQILQQNTHNIRPTSLLKWNKHEKMFELCHSEHKKTDDGTTQ